jgi:hypothetical protein
MKIPVMPSVSPRRFGLALATTVVVAQAPKQLQIFAGVLDGTGAPAQSLDVGDVQ